MPRRTRTSSSRRAARGAGLQACPRSRWAIVAAALLLLTIPARRAESQATHFDSGQNVVPVFEGWEKRPDGSFDMVFGYMNRNYVEELNLPVGPDNTIEPGAPDQGQPTHFYPRRQQFVFKVHVPKDWGKKDLIWTLKVGGKIEKAYASLLPFWELGPFVYQENRGSGAEITDAPEPNDPPAIKIAGATQLSSAVDQTVTLVADVTDDGHPAPRRRAAPGGAGAAATAAPPVRRDSDGGIISPQPVAQTGTPGPGGSGPRRESPLTQALVRLEPGVSLGVTWIVYRGAAENVTIQPQRVAVTNGKAETKISVKKPGTYVLRAYADDGVYVTPADVTVTVK